jgi:hypothetical protein
MRDTDNIFASNTSISQQEAELSPNFGDSLKDQAAAWA